MKTLLFISLSLCFLDAQAQFVEKWTQLGSGTPKNQTSMPSMAFDRNGHLYLAYTDQSTPQNKATLKKFDGQNWTTLSNQFTPGEAMFIRLDLDSSDVPYVAFQEPHPVTKKITVMKFNGSGWDTVGARGFATAHFSNPELDFAINRNYNIPTVAFRENSSGKASVMFNAGSSWMYSGGSGITEGDATKLSLSTQGNLTYLAFRNGARDGKLSVITDNGGGSWAYSGDTIKSAGIPDFIKCHRYLGGAVPVVAIAYKDLSDNKAYLKMSSLSWSAANNTPLSDGAASYVTLAQKRGLTLHSSIYCGYADLTIDANATVKKVSTSSAGSYTLIGKKGFTDTLGIFGAAYFATMGIDKHDSLYLAAQTFNEYVVFKFRSINTNLTGLQHNMPDSDVSMFPNPTTHWLTLRTGSGPIGSFRLFNASGQLILFENAIQAEEFTADLSFLPEGLYFLEAGEGANPLRRKLIKN